MTPKSFSIGDRFRLHGRGYSPKESYTVVEVSEDRIQAWMSPPKWSVPCTFDRDFFKGFVGEIEMLPSEAEKSEVFKRATRIIETGIVNTVAADFTNEGKVAA